ncbi:MAG: TIGR04222 domain-containing membrane protein, partial [Streptomycetaceae bacterium]|nr:TIGR04222 domain-containing membrane protein [Streptomycetaceae bacterium]
MDIALIAVYLAWVTFVLGYATVALRVGRTRGTRTPTPPVDRLDLYQAAFLTGGPARTADAALLALRATGSVHIGRDGTVTTTGRGAADAVSAGVLRVVEQAGGTAPLTTVRYGGARSPEVQAVGDGLSACRLMRPRGALRRHRMAGRLVNVTSAGGMIGGVLV